MADPSGSTPFGIGAAVPVLERAFAAGERASRRAAAGLSVVEILDGSPSWYADADVPADLPTEP